MTPDPITTQVIRNALRAAAPKQRDPERVRLDVENGLISLAEAREVYGYQPS